METNAFCGQVCHTPMKPQATAHAEWPHARVTCVSCHVGPGAAGTFRAKLNGTRQAWEFMRGSFARPIASPAPNIPTPDQTCVRCHAIERMPPMTTVVKRTYDEDEANTETVSTLELFTRAAHWHARPDITVEYLAGDATRETIPYVRVTRGGEPAVEYAASTAGARPDRPWKRMDCLDCHNRPAHTMFPTPEAAVDGAIAGGDIAASLPFIRREAVKALAIESADESAGIEAIRRTLGDFYRTAPAPAADVSRATATVERLYRTNVFPEMRISWGTYRSLLGHVEGSGCFRCHDDEHKSRDGGLVRQDCELCHLEK
jgi:hypothetical protein